MWGNSDQSHWFKFRDSCREAAATIPDAAPRPPLAETGNKKEPTELDGPFDGDGFRFGGVEVRFGRARTRYALVLSLWDRPRGVPTAPRPVQDVIDEVYGSDNDTTDNAFRQLCSDTRGVFQKVNCPLNISTVNGTVQLTRV